MSACKGAPTTASIPTEIFYAHSSREAPTCTVEDVIMGSRLQVPWSHHEYVREVLCLTGKGWSDQFPSRNLEINAGSMSSALAMCFLTLPTQHETAQQLLVQPYNELHNGTTHMLPTPPVQESKENHINHMLNVPTGLIHLMHLSRKTLNEHTLVLATLAIQS